MPRSLVRKKNEKRPYRTYSETERVIAINRAYELKSVTKAAAELNLKHETLKSWIAKDRIKVVEVGEDEAYTPFSGDLRDHHEQALKLTLSAAAKKLPKATLPQITNLLATLFGQHQTLSDQPGSISEIRSRDHVTNVNQSTEMKLETKITDVVARLSDMANERKQHLIAENARRGR